MAAVLMFTRDGTTHRRELTGGALTIGRGPECELRIADERVSIRHCRFEASGDSWAICDLKSTNRTFVNGELVSDAPRRLRHGDFIRLGAHDARLFEATFEVVEVPGERARAHQAVSAAQLQRLTEELAARDAEIARLGALYKAAQLQIHKHEADAHAASRMRAALTTEIEGLRSELGILATELAGARDQRTRADRGKADLEAERDAQLRKARRDLDDANRHCKDLESRVGLAASELATTRAALATAEDNVRRIKEAYDDVLVQLR